MSDELDTNPAPFEEYAVDVAGLGTVTVIDPAGEPGYRYRLADGQVSACTAQSGDPIQANAAADIAYAIAHPRTPAPCAVIETCVGTRVALAGSFLHSEIATTSGVTLLGVIPAGWAMVDFQVRIGTAFDAARTISLGTAVSPARWINALPVSTIGFKQATPLQLFPQSIASGTYVYLKKSAATTVGDIINVTALIERKY